MKSKESGKKLESKATIISRTERARVPERVSLD